MQKDNNHVIKPSQSWMLSMNLRSWIQPPQKVIDGNIKSGMKVLDFGCGTGFLTPTIANIVGNSGKVYAVDLQTEMLEKLNKNLIKYPYNNRIEIHQCGETEIGLDKNVDYIITCFVLHEVPDQKSTLKQFYNLLNANGTFHLIEPKFHVSKKTFASQIQKAKEVGFKLIESKQNFGSQTAIFVK